MNIERGLPQLGIAKASDARGPSPSKVDDGKPAFELPDHDAMPAKDAFAPERVHARTSAPASTANDAMRTRDAAAPPREASEAAPHDAAKPHDGPNAAARREDRDGNGSPARTDDDKPTTASTDAATPAAADAGTDRQTASGDDTDALPDRMLALLSGAPLAPAAAPVGPTTTGYVGLAVAGTTAEPAALPSASAPSVQPTTALQPGAQIPAAALTGDGNALSALATPAAASKDAANPFAALAALGERPREGAVATTDSTSTGTAFAPLLARGIDAAQGAARAAPAVAPAPLPLMLDADFDDGLGARVVWMAEQRIDHAQIRVSPEALGPIDVRLQLDGHRVNAQFHASNADVRQALESGMDRLRDMLGRQGMELGQTQVGGGSRQGADNRGGSAPLLGRDAAGDALPADAPSMRVAIPRSRGLLDEYA